MPTYNYKCLKCGIFEAVKSFDERKNATCPRCSSTCEKTLSTHFAPLEVWSYLDSYKGSMYQEGKQQQLEKRRDAHYAEFEADRIAEQFGPENVVKDIDAPKEVTTKNENKTT